MAKKWMPYHWQIPLAEEEIPMDKGGFRTVVIDVKKVINGLRGIKTYLASQAIETKDDLAREGFIESQMDIDCAIALLKEQEKIPVVFSQSDGAITTSCGNCGWDLDKTYSRCPRCQKELDWNALQE